MRSSEFLNEAGRDGTPMTDAEFAAQQAQGAKNWDSIKGFGQKIAGALGGNAQAATPYPDAATARASLTPSQLKWLGAADPMDKYIMARMPAPLPGETVAAAPVNVVNRNDGNPPPIRPGTGYGDDDTSVFAATPVANAVAASGQPDDVTGVDAAVAANTAAAANTGQQTTPPAKKLAPVDPGTKELQTWLKNKGYNIGKFGADGRFGSDTAKAIAAWKAKGLKPGNPEFEEYAALLGKAHGMDYREKKTAPAGGGRGDQGGPTASELAVGAQGGRGGQGGPTASELAAVQAPQAATPTPSAPPKPIPAAPPPKPVVGQPMANGKRASQSDVMSWDNQYGPAGAERAASAAAAAKAKQEYNPYAQNKVSGTTNFEESVNRMRRLSTLLKG